MGRSLSPRRLRHRGGPGRGSRTPDCPADRPPLHGSLAALLPAAASVSRQRWRDGGLVSSRRSSLGLLWRRLRVPTGVGKAAHQLRPLFGRLRFTEALGVLPPTLPAHLGCCFAKLDRKSTRLNSSHLGISYAVFCLKKKTTKPPYDGQPSPLPSTPARSPAQPGT